MGQSPNSKNYTNNPRDNILVQGNADLYNNRVLKRTFTTEVTKIADRNDILISVRAPVGDIARNQYESIVIGRGIAAIKGNNFLYYQLEKMNNSGFWKKYIAGSTFESITGKDLKSSDIYISNHKEEKSIGDIFQTLTKTIQLHERKCEELALIKKALLQKLFPKKDEFKPEVRYKNFSDAWEQRKLGEVATFINGRAYKQNELLDSGKYKVLRVGNFYTNDSWYYSNLELADKYYIDKGDLVYTWSATFGPHIWDGEKVIYHYHIWKIELSESLDRDFTLQILEADKAKLLANTNGSTMIHVTKKDMESKVISLPNIEEQKQIGSYLMKFDSLIALHQRKLEKLKQLKKFLLQNMFI
ncbi:restriction endonuclease subunit S [Lactobacillus salivarius]|nr:restriction endonuclease subunit S [Ligilactobacillus salivarius]MYY88427.1 restriction endonuclease subunit S [Ligilactobacillus salivarius]MYZ21909.1 restriction endonuclease subunit S [Ligilactobacillus salivarius]UIP50686.1 restriction endonuclease subunit S [Ligilactobacillus salivarius]